MKAITLISARELPAMLRRMRQGADMTLKEAAERAGLSFSFISDLEHGRTQPSLDTVNRLAAAYGFEFWLALKRL